MTANSFRLGLAREAEKIDEEILKVKRRAAAHALRSLDEKMPVATGRARANNIVSIGRRDYDWAEIFDPLGRLALNAGLEVIRNDRDPKASIFIQNNVAYIEALEGGHSAQAPLGMYGVTFSELLALF